MDARETVIPRRTIGLVVASILLISTMALLLLVNHCSQEEENLRSRVRELEWTKRAADLRADHFQAESKAKDIYLATVTSLLNEVGSRIEQIQQDQQEVGSLSVQSGGDSLRIVKHKSIPQALEKIDAEIKDNRQQIAQLESLVVAGKSENQGLKSVVERLKKQNSVLDDQLYILRRKIGGLSKQVKNLESQVDKMKEEVVAKDRKLEEKEFSLVEQGKRLEESETQREASEAARWLGYSVLGTREELSKRGILVSGPFQSLKKPRLSEHFDAYLRESERVDTRNLREIQLGVVKEVMVLPLRPQSSYGV